MMDSGILRVCPVRQTHKPGFGVKETLGPGNDYFYQERTIGYGRQYAAKGVGERVDKLVRIWEDRSITIGMVAIEESIQYRIDAVQHMPDENGLRVTQLTLGRLDQLYDIDES